jgi:transglutaminase-like putative cysteine protease
MKKTAFAFALLATLSSYAGKYPSTEIPAALLKNAHAVKRMEEIRFEIKSLNETIHTRRFALTILDEQGQDYADLVVGYDKLRKVSSIEGTLYDAAGNQLKKVKGKEIKDVSAVQDNLFDDSRLKVHAFDYHTYPYTVEYEVEIIYNQTYLFPSWMPQNAQYLAVEKSSYTLVSPENYAVRYKAFNYKPEPVTTSEKGKKTMTWSAANMPAFTKPYASPRWNELTTTVYFSPSEFQMENYKASAASWQELGKFGSQLTKDRDQLPPALLAKVQQLTTGITDPMEKVKKLYEFMQQNTRYISIQLGIGGLQPFEASYVAQKGYGDCKALSNYLYSMLKAIGIKSYQSWIQGGREIDDQYIMEDFPSDQFNHQVLFVPLAKDTMWLECTSQTNPAGYMGSFTGNRKALAITEDGGKLVSTPRYGLEENLQIRNIKAVLDEEGNLTANIRTSYKAQQQDYIFSMLNVLSKNKVKEYLNGDLDFSTYDIINFAYTPRKEVLPEVEEQLQLTVANYATVSGKRLFILPNMMTRSGKKPISPEDRKFDYVFEYAYRDIDSVEIAVPAGYQLEALPQSMNVKTPYGNYFSEVKVEGAKITYYRRMEHFAGRYPVNEGVAIEKFFTDIYKADRSRVVLVKKEA